MKDWRVIGYAALLVVATAGVSRVSAAADKDKDKAPAEKVRAARTDKAPASDVTTGAAGSPAEAPAEDSQDDAAPDPMANVPHLVGPTRVQLGHHAEIDLPAGMLLLEQAAAQDLMRRLGNNIDGVVATILPAANTARWMVVIAAHDVGYVNDDDADELDAQAILEQLQQGTLEQNKKRVAMGVPELILDGWSEPPRYEPATRHVVWGLNAHDTDGKVVNFFTRFLGRHGFLSVNLVDDPVTIDASKTQALSILTAVRFEPGSRYEDLAGGDRDSGIGLKALVLGGTGVVIAKKTGILIAIAVALKKGVIVVLAAIGGFFRWLFRRKKQGQAAEPTTPEAPDPDPPSAG